MQTAHILWYSARAALRILLQLLPVIAHIYQKGPLVLYMQSMCV